MWLSLLSLITAAVLVTSTRILAPWLDYCDADLLESSEFLALLGEEKLTTYILEASKDNYSLADHMQKNLDKDQFQLWKKTLKYRLMSASVVTHIDLYPFDAPECETFAEIAGQFFCNPKNIIDHLDDELVNSDVKQSDFGHVLGNGHGRRIYLYSHLGSPSFPSFHSILKELSETGKCKYIYRHIVTRGCKESTSMRGYGIEFEVKEFGDSNVTYDEWNLAKPSEEAKKNVKFSLQVLQKILDSDNPMEEMNFLSENLPLVANDLQIVKLDQEVMDKANALSQHFNIPEVSIKLNGIDLHVNNFDLLPMLEFLTEYKAVLDQYLSGIPKASQLASKIMSDTSEPLPIRYDVRHESVLFLNDLEKDSRYKAWPTTYKTLFRPPMGQAYQLARNIIVLTVVLDVSKTPMFVLTEIRRMLEQSLPYRMGLVLIDADPRVVDILYATYALNGPQALMEYLYLIAESRDQRGFIDYEKLFWTVKGSLRIYDKLTIQESIKKTDATLYYKKAINFIERFEVDTMPMFFINGRPITTPIKQLGREVLRLYQDEIYHLQMRVFNYDITDEDDYYTQLMEGPKVYKSRSSIVEGVQRLVDLKQFDEQKWIKNGVEPVKYTVAIIADVNRPVDRVIVSKWLRTFEKSDEGIKLAIISVQLEKSMPLEYFDAILELMEGTTSTQEAIQLLEESEEVGLSNNVKSINKIVGENLGRFRNFAKDLIQGPLVILNGRIYGPFNELTAQRSQAEHFLQYEYNNRVQRFESFIKALDMSPSNDPESMFASMAQFEVAIQWMVKRKNSFFTSSPTMALPAEKLNCFTSGPDEALVKIDVLLNPFTTPSSHITAVLLELDDLVQAAIIVNIQMKVTSINWNSIYRFRNFDGRLGPLPDGTKGAIMLKTPLAWDCQQTSDIVDVDNYEYHQSDKLIEFPLKGLLIEGKVGFENAPAAGMKMQMRQYKSGKLVDETISLSTFGYFQMRISHPGIYLIDVAQNAKYSGISVPRVLAADSLSMNPIDVKLRGPPLTAHAISQLFVGDEDDKTVHVFSIASGATYERLIRIMMYSVVSNTKAPVKFWIFSTFTTPSFADKLRILSSKLKFSYELVNYRWPSWLNRQNKKHRRVWAHKILFLDLLPHVIKRLIYIDADQVMRGDVSELRDIDLDGKVYGFAPFCEDRSESEAFRFWKQGYWTEALQGAPYHISALFVVDMPLFRARGISDRLRHHYQMLSFDPESLANLDQDLPNDLQRDIKIHALPAEWLWCETWCSDLGKGRAKSIDLCNNPGKHEGKLEQARRIIPEWTTYDQKVTQILESDEEFGKVESEERDRDEL